MSLTLLLQGGPEGATESHPWALGWEFAVALATLLLATVTGWLAWTTRRLARTTAEEVQGQIRPVVVPARKTVTSTPGTGPHYFDVAITLRNIGAGPALNFKLTIGEGSHSESLQALGAGSEGRCVVHVPSLRENEGAHSYYFRTNSLTIEYFDLAGRRFVSQVPIVGGLSADGESKVQGQLTVASGMLPTDDPIVGPALTENPLMAAEGTPGIRQAPFAWRYYVWQDPDAPPRPLWPRLKEAWRWMYPRHRRTRLQRLAWARRAYKATLDKPVRPWVPGVLEHPYKIARGWKWAYRVYRNMRY